MIDTVRIVGICGSLRRASLNRCALRAAAALLPPDTTLEVAEIAHIPAYNEDVREHGIPASVRSLADQVGLADAVLIVTPEYNYSIPGVLKNALDWVCKTEHQPFQHKPVAIMGASPELSGTSLAQHHLRQILVCLNARVMSEREVMIGAADVKFDERGRLVDEPTREAIGGLIEALVKWTRMVES
jgi:chromate reductase